MGLFVVDACTWLRRSLALKTAQPLEAYEVLLAGRCNDRYVLIMLLLFAVLSGVVSGTRLLAVAVKG